jgi:multiple antibiotic resistance protein
MLIGSHLLVFFGITLPVVRIVGGLVLIAFGWKLLHDGVEPEDKRSSETRSHSTAIDSFYPLTMPLTVGPGSIAVAIGLGSQRPEGPLHYHSLPYSADRLSRGSSRLRLQSMFIIASRSVQPPN